MENDKLAVDLKRKNEMIKKYAQKVTTLETELYQVKEYLGQTGNTADNEDEDSS